MPVDEKGEPIILTDKGILDWRGELARVYPVLRGGGLLDVIAEQIEEEIQRALKKGATTTIHGATIAGMVSEVAGEMGTWVTVGGKGGDGKNCGDCLELHGTRMTSEQFENTKYTTQCDGNCRCWWVPEKATREAGTLEIIARDELQ